MIKKRKKVKQVALPTDFNPGTMSYQSTLPLKKSGKRVKLEVNWKWIVILSLYIVIALILTLFY